MPSNDEGRGRLSLHKVIAQCKGLASGGVREGASRSQLSCSQELLLGRQSTASWRRRFNTNERNENCGIETRLGGVRESHLGFQPALGFQWKYFTTPLFFVGYVLGVNSRWGHLGGVESTLDTGLSLRVLRSSPGSVTTQWCDPLFRGWGQTRLLDPRD